VKKRRWLEYSVWAPPLVLLLCLALGRTGPARRLESFLLDRLIELRHKAGGHADPRLFFVAIDDPTIHQLKSWPIARIFHGEMLGFLSAVHPAAVAWDVLFADEDSINDDAFIQGIQMFGAPVVLAASRAEQGAEAPDVTLAEYGLTHPLPRVEGDSGSVPAAPEALLPIAALRKVCSFGFVDSSPDLDGIRRKVPMVVRIGARFFPSFALQALMQFWNAAPEQVRVVLGDAVYIDAPQARRRIPISASGEFIINYHYEEDGFDSAGYGALHDALAQNYNGVAVKNLPRLKGRLIVIGLASTGSSEIGPSPLSPKSLVPLVHMNVLDNILREDYLRVADKWAVWLPWLLITMASLRYFERLDSRVSAAGLASLCFAALGAMYLFFVKADLWIPLGMPLLGFAGVHFGGAGALLLRERLAKNRIKNAFSSYLAPSVLEQVLKNSDELKLGGVRKTVTILFSDIRGFTSMSESAGEEGLVAQLNEYFTEMVACVHKHGGTLHKFIGDAIMAVWGDAVSKGGAEDARAALRAALDMREALAQLNLKWSREGRPPLKIGVGLNHGNVLAGNIGSPRRMEFTVIGDAVNVASRIEGLTKEWHTDIAAGPQVKDLAGGQFFFRTLGTFRLMGKREGLRVFAVARELGIGESPPEAMRLYEEAYAHYFEGDFPSAAAGFELFLAAAPGDAWGEQYLTLCRELLEKRPDAPWDGIHTLKSK